MGPKPQKKKGPKQAEKKVANILSTLQLEEDSEYDDLEVVDGGEGGPEEVDQLELPEEELNKDVTLILKAENPYFSEEFIEYSFKDLEFKTSSHFPDTVTFYSHAGSIIHKSQAHEAGKKLEDAPELEEINEEPEGKRKNKFNYYERAVQTMNPAVKDECLQTEPPAEATFNGDACLWEIMAAYDAADQAKGLNGNAGPKADAHRKVQASRIEKDDIPALESIAKVMERMINQNRFIDIVLDFSYYDNPCDEFLEQGKGSLLPLWKFKFKEMKGSTVMSISWNNHYTDMFAIAFGSSEFFCEVEGCICVYTLKCTSYPERVFKSDVSVQCVDFHKQWPYLLAAGFSDGSVAVFDLRYRHNQPKATSRNYENGHENIVSQVKWLVDDINQQHNFCSISLDGKVINWTLTESELIPSEVVVLKREGCDAEGPENTVIKASTGGTSASFNAGSMELFLVGTEVGLVHTCSCLYTNQYLSTFNFHTNRVHSVEWNPYHPRVFLTCSADWTIYIWDHTSPEMYVFTFDMPSEVMAAAWAPFSSTLFAAVTRDKKENVRVFDLLMNRQSATCSHTVYDPKKHTTLSTVSFNPKMPILMVGDQKGLVTSFKLSPNLRSSLKAMHDLEKSKFVENEIDKMEKVLKLAKSPGAKSND